jgi:hypothetical protein
MKTKVITCIGLLALLLVGAAGEAKPGFGISSWAGWKPGDISRADCPELRSVPLILKWDDLEAVPGNYAFDEKIGKPLEAAHADGLFVTLMIWVGPDAPEWIYSKGVPVVTTDRAVNALGKKTNKQRKYPYYLHPEYKKGFLGLIDAFGSYINALPRALRERIVMVQCAEGSTGDGQPYKGKPINKKQAISDEDWNNFRLEAWDRYRKAIPSIPILVNADANGSQESEWLLDNMEVIALKEGMFSHGYLVSDNDIRLAKHAAIEAAANKRGKSVLMRGEMDGELFEMGWSNRNIPQALYWSGIFASHGRLDIWNVPTTALKDNANWPAFVFFNKYAGHRNLSTAPAAFCALHDGLDASDFERFPAAKFGGTPGNKKDANRYLKITKAYAAYGARMDDPQKAVGGGMLNRKSKGLNDAGWGILAGNYSRFLTQINPGSGDVGRWNIDESIYGRFARAFERASGKTRMSFRIDDGFFNHPHEPQTVQLRIVYLDKGEGVWELLYANADGKNVARQVELTGSGKWLELTETLQDAVWNHRLPGGGDVALRHVSGEDTAFHLVELNK